jgi:vitamin-K-epoxide reductase (warfarin-sensitive)
MRYLIAVLALAGAVVSGLALQVHYSTKTEPCSINEHWDCGVVNHSPFAVIGHVPVAAIGIAGYVLLAAMALLGWRFVLMVMAFAAFSFALRLTFIEEFDLGVWCLYCVISQGIIALVMLLSVGWLGADYAALKRAERRRI